jgi:hypothetical protein
MFITAVARLQPEHVFAGKVEICCFFLKNMCGALTIFASVVAKIIL